MTMDSVAELLDGYTTEVRDIALALRDLVRETVPEAVEDVDQTAALIGFTLIPGTYRGLFAAVAPQREYVNLMFSKGVELMEVDDSGLLEGTGKKARHVKVRSLADVAEPGLGILLAEAANLTPRS